MAATTHRLIQGDARRLLLVADGSVDLVIADPPYGLAKKKPLEGITYPGSKDFTSDNAHTYETLGAQWDVDVQNDYGGFTLDWMTAAHRKLRDGGSMLICSTQHSLTATRLMGEALGMKFVSMITWAKVNAPPSITRRQPTPSTEQITWFCKGKGWTYDVAAAREEGGDKQLRDFWLLPILGRKESMDYRSQKPLRLITRMVRIASKVGDLVLDPMAGTGTTTIVCDKLGRRSCSYEYSTHAIAIAKQRFQDAGIAYTEPTEAELTLATGAERVQLPEPTTGKASL